MHNSESLYRSVIAAMAEGIVVQDASGAIVSTNGSAEQILGLTADQLQGRTSVDPRWRSVREDGSPFHGEDHPSMITLRTAVPQHNVIMGVCKPDGSLTWISINTQPIFDPGSSQPSGVVASFHDITQSRRTQQALKESDERFQYALESVGDGVWDWNITTGAVFFSARWKAMLGYADHELRDDFAEFDSRLHDQDRAGLYEVLEKYLAGQLPAYKAEIRLRCQDGSYKWILTRGKVIARDAEGKPLRFVGTHTDISEQKRLEQMKDEFVSTVSHELRTPLTSIQGGIKLALSGILGTLPQKAEQLLHVANNNVERLSHLVNDILDVQRLESGRIHYELEVCAVCDLIEAAVAADQTFAQRKEVQIRFPFCEATRVRVDRLRFAQVMSNLLSNAIKFSPEGGQIDVKAVRQGAEVVISVRDYGTGIPESFRAKIFERFSQADRADNRSIQRGTGLGLNITRKLVEDMHGRIWFETVEGRGTTFLIALPDAEPVAPSQSSAG